MDESLYEEIENLEEYPNATQLIILQKEIHFIMQNEFMPPLDWFDLRIDKLHAYDNLNWEELHSQSFKKDSYIHVTSMKIKEMLRRLIDEWSNYSVFDLPTYQIVIDYIHCIWKYYSAYYMMDYDGDDEEDEEEKKDIETDADMLNIIERMQHYL